MLQAHLVYFLAQLENQTFLQGALFPFLEDGICYWGTYGIN